MSASGADTRTAGPDGTPPAGRLFITVLCGGADRPVAELGGLTPFEAAATPTWTHSPGAEAPPRWR